MNRTNHPLEQKPTQDPMGADPNDSSFSSLLATNIRQTPNR